MEKHIITNVLKIGLSELKLKKRGFRLIKQIKEKTGLKGYQLAQFLEVSEPTIYAWEKKNTWPLWALEKCKVKISFSYRELENLRNCSYLNDDNFWK